MGFSNVFLDYLLYSVYQADGVRLKWTVFVRQRELRRRYEDNFGKDRFLIAPELFGGFAVLVLAISGFALVFAQH